MTDEPLIRLEDVEKRYGRQSVLRVEQLTIRRGERIVLVGPNGCGKSTLLRLLARITPPSRGRVWWSAGLSRAVLGYVPQDGGLYPELTVQDNLDLRRSLYGKPPLDPREQRHVRSLGLVPLLQQRFSRLSGGFQRLAALSAAVHIDPDWLILDEPLAAVERPLGEALHRELAARAERLLAVVLAAPAADAYPGANRRIGLEQGRIAWAEP